MSRADSDIELYGSSRTPGTVAGILFLEKAEEPKIVISGGTFGDPKRIKEVELAAVSFVQKELKARGFKVRDCQKDNCGYDLYATSQNETLLVEVKGTVSIDPRFFLTRNEFNVSQVSENWRLFIVTNACANPVLHEYPSHEMRDSFIFDALAWEATPHSNKVK